MYNVSKSREKSYGSTTLTAPQQQQSAPFWSVFGVPVCATLACWQVTSKTRMIYLLITNPLEPKWRHFAQVNIADLFMLSSKLSKQTEIPYMRVYNVFSSKHSKEKTCDVCDIVGYFAGFILQSGQVNDFGASIATYPASSQRAFRMSLDLSISHDLPKKPCAVGWPFICKYTMRNNSACPLHILNIILLMVQKSCTSW